jgi:orotidine-5'-phosphate decarboxylase
MIKRDNAQKRLIVAMDTLELKQCLNMVDTLSPVVDIFKIGIAPFTAFGEEILAALAKRGKKVFLDLKFHDIPNTVRNAASVAASKGVLMMNFHCLGGRKMLEAAVRGAKEGFSGRGEKPLLLGVTVLTSMDESDMKEIGLGGDARDTVLCFALMAKQAGLDGVVASPKEARAIKEKCGRDFVVVTPGIRPAWADTGDQKRIDTPAEAMKNGIDYIVVGRPIIEAENPLEAAQLIIEEMTKG